MKNTTIIESNNDLKAFIGKLENVNIENPVLIETSLYKPKRSQAINRLMWMWNGEIQVFLREHMGQIYSAEDIHEYMINLLLPRKAVEINGRTRDIRAHTSKMNNKEMCQYLELLDHYCSSELGLLLTHPMNVYDEAMSERN